MTDPFASRRASSDRAVDWRQRRLDHGLTQEAVADRLNITSERLSRIERGLERMPRRWFANAWRATGVAKREPQYVCPRGHRHHEGFAFCTVCGAGPVLRRRF